jgi:acyl-homoserine lactone synthase
LGSFLSAAAFYWHLHQLIMCGVLEHCLDNGITGLTALIEMFWLPLFHSMGWNLIPLGLPELINGEWSIAVKMPIDEKTLTSTSAFHGITGRVCVATQRRSVTGGSTWPRSYK